MELIFTASLWFAAIGCGLMAGVYFTFSAFVMKALAQIPATQGIKAMQSINKVIVSSAFLPLFSGTSIAGLVLMGLSPLFWDTGNSFFAAAGGTVYVLGMFVCTMVFNVPLNNKLAALEPNSSNAENFWQTTYLRNWTRWNHLRTAASTAASVLFTCAIRLS